MESTAHRMDIPKVQRHGYCVNSISYEDAIMQYGLSALGGEYKKYCFCNDWNGCNHAGRLTASWLMTLPLLLLAVTLFR